MAKFMTSVVANYYVIPRLRVLHRRLAQTSIAPTISLLPLKVLRRRSVGTFIAGPCATLRVMFTLRTHPLVDPEGKPSFFWDDGNPVGSDKQSEGQMLICFHNESFLMQDLAKCSIKLIHHTETVAAIKHLITAHEILDLNIKIAQDFEGIPPWDVAAFKHLDLIRFELLTTFPLAFAPPTILTRYSNKMINLFKIMNLRI